MAGFECGFTGDSPDQHRAQKTAIIAPLSADERAVLLAMTDTDYVQPVGEIAATARVRIGITRTALRRMRQAGLIDWEDRGAMVGLCAWLTDAGRAAQAQAR